ncbi:MAG TPA: hypothetical protein VF017_18420 [Thermoanaerobaculia bacterium]|nr:hypothetical protein [Thermoanaerobaculia bacterium]
MSTERSPQPAIRSYFFGKGYRDLWDTIRDSWLANVASAGALFEKAGSAWPRDHLGKLLAVLFGSAGVAVMVFGTVFFAAFSLLHVSLLGLFFLLVYLGFSLVFLLEKAYLGIKGFFTVCPACHERMPLPEYLCPQCGAVHTRLIPSSWGILNRTCQCGQRLPATFFLGRGELPSRCPECQHLLQAGHTESRKHFVPLYGGPAVGKTAFLCSAASQLLQEGPAGGFECGFLEERTAQTFAALHQDLARGRTPDKTHDTLPRAFNLEMRRLGQDPRVLYLYDPAGEVFDRSDDLVLHKFQGYLSGLLFLVDPFSLPEVRRQHGGELALLEPHLRPSRLPVEDALARFFLNLEENFELAKTAKVRVPVAVVVNKIDALALEREHEEAVAAARARANGRPATGLPPEDEGLRELLIRWGASDLVQQLEARCARLRYFACSSLGRMPDGSSDPFAGRGVLPPLWWVLGSQDPAFFGRA